MSETHTLDATGLLCPLPVLKLAKRLKSMEIGARITVQADDPAAVVDVPHYCAESGHLLVESGESGGVYRFVVEKTG